jgi:hypothetical protein
MKKRYSSYTFLTSALEGGEWSASRPGCALPPGKEAPVPIVQEVGWAPGPVWTQRLEEKSSASVRDRNKVMYSSVNCVPVVMSCVKCVTGGATVIALSKRVACLKQRIWACMWFASREEKGIY